MIAPLRLPCVPVIPAALLVAVLVQAQGTPPAAPLTLLSRDGRRPVPTTIQNGQELVSLDDVAALFGVSVREDALAGGVTVAYKGRSIVVSFEQPIASVEGRLVSLPAPVTRSGRSWHVPVEFLSRALAPIYDRRIELRKAARLLIVGDIRVPRVVTRVESPGPPTRLTIEITPATPATLVQAEGRITVRLDAPAIDAASPPSGAGLVTQIVVEAPASLILQLDPRAGVHRAAVAQSGNSTLVTVDVPTEGAGDTPTAPPAVSEPLPPIAAPRTALQAIVLDPGHGGDQNGVTGPDGTQEKQIALEVARRVKTLIETRLGIRVVLTREDDRAVTPDQRAAIANNTKADLFLSLHANGAPAANVAGAEVFYVSLDREGEEALREAQAVTLPAVGGGTRVIDVIRWDLAQARHLASSAVLARTLEEELRARVPMGPRPLQQAPLRVLVGVNMPAALVEIAYLTNPEQEQRARSAEFQTAVTQAIYDSVLRFRAFLESRGAAAPAAPAPVQR